MTTLTVMDKLRLEEHLPIEVISKEALRKKSICLTAIEWYKAAQLGDSYWLYVVWDPLANPDPEPLKIRNPVKHLDHAKREVVRYFDIPADAILNAARAQGDCHEGDHLHQQCSEGAARRTAGRRGC